MPLFMAVVAIAITTSSLWIVRIFIKVSHIEIGLKSANEISFAARAATLKQWSRFVAFPIEDSSIYSPKKALGYTPPSLMQ